MFPAPLRQKLLGRFVKTTPLFSDRTTTEPRLLLWLEIRTGATTNRPWSTNVWLILADEQGQAAGERREIDFWSGNASRGEVSEFRAFPRCGRQIGVVLVQGSYDKPAVVGQWRIPNPARNTARSWEPELHPLTLTNGDLECTLEGLTVFASERGGGMGLFRERGVETNTWTIGSITLADVTGNILPTSGARASWSQIRNTVLFHWDPVWWAEEAWELRLLAKRTAEAQFPPGEMAEFKVVAVPGLDTPVDLNDEITVHGVTLRIKQFVLRQRADPRGWSSDKVSQLKVVVTGLTNGVFLNSIKATDDEGRTYRCGSWGGSSGSGAPSEFSFEYPDMTNLVKRLNFTFAVQRGVPFTFRLKPEFVSTNAIVRVKQ